MCIKELLNDKYFYLIGEKNYVVSDRPLDDLELASVVADYSEQINELNATSAVHLPDVVSMATASIEDVDFENSIPILKINGERFTINGSSAGWESFYDDEL